jgi:hypothetical protein
MKTIYDTPTPYQRPTVSFTEWMKDVQARHLIGPPEQCINKMEQLKTLGVNHFVIKFVNLKERSDSPQLFMQEVINQIK